MTDGPEGAPHDPEPSAVRPWLIGGLVALAVMVVGLAVLSLLDDGDGSSTPASVAGTPSLVPVTGPFAGGRTPVSGFGETAMRVTAADGEEKLFCVLAARTSAQLQRGLMEVTDEDLGGYDGMAFLFPRDVSGGFWMRNTPMPLSLAYLDGDGALVSTVDMAPCADVATCPTYRPKGPFRTALEVPQGRLDDLGVGPGATVTTGGACRARP